MVSAIVLGLVLLVAVAWLLVQFTLVLRPAVSEAMGYLHVLTVAPDGALVAELPVGAVAVAVVLALFIHEFVHGLLFWWFTGRRPVFGFQGLLIYAAAPPGICLPRDRYLIAGLAPLVLLTLVGLLLMLIVLITFVPILSFFLVFNTAGAGGDLVMVAKLLSYSPDNLLQDRDTGVVVYGPGEHRGVI